MTEQKDDFQRRLILTMAIGAGLVVAWPWIFPPTPRAVDDAAAEGASSGAEAGATGGDEATAPKREGTDFKPDGSKPDGSKPAPLDPKSKVPAASAFVEHDIVEHELRNSEVALRVTNAGGGLLSFAEPLDPHFSEPDGSGIDFLRLSGSRSLTVGFAPESTVDWSSPRGLEVTEKSERAFGLRASSGQIQLDERLELREGGEAFFVVEIRNLSAVALDYRLRLSALRGQEEVRDSYDQLFSVCRSEGSIQRWDAADYTEGKPEFFKSASWVATDTKYFTQALVPLRSDFDCELSAPEDGDFSAATLQGPQVSLAPGGSERYEFGVYLGPKVEEKLQDFSLAKGVALEQVIDWGWFRTMSRFLGLMMLQLLRFFHNLTGVWAVAIVMLTVVVKLLLVPLTIKQMRSMRKMKEIQPELDAINKKYASDLTKRNQEIQALMARNGANPLAGCFPLLLQLPIWWALYTMLSVSVDLYREPFLWVPDLTKYDPLYILPLGLGVMSFLQARIQPAPADNQQAQMMQWTMPVVFTVMMLFLPAGLNVYIFANTALSVLQSWIMLRGAGPKATPASNAKA